MKYVVAVSGGVDSVVLLDMLVKANEHDLIVAHFDHGIRSDSAADARFVEGLANTYDLQYVIRREELGSDASELEARSRRYAFLHMVAASSDSTVVTAHHQDDIIESIAINLVRGTGWRGLAVMGDHTIDRPLKQLQKSTIYDYAMKNELEWVEDETNQSDIYLRNRIRRKLGVISPEKRKQLAMLHERQAELTGKIDNESALLPKNSRYFLTMVDQSVALELLRAWLDGQSVSLTRPQRVYLLHAIKTGQPGQLVEPGNGITIELTAREFIVKHPL